MSNNSSNQAIYSQISEYPSKERNMIEKATIREVYIDKLESISNKIKQKQIEINMKCVFDVFRLLNKIREATIDAILAIMIWEEEFTIYMPPKIHGCRDYIDDMLIKNTRILGASIFKNIFNFNLISGNILLLPMKSRMEEVPLADVDAVSFNEIQSFCSPNMDHMVEVYQVLLNLLPEQLYKKLVPIQSWIDRPWIPPINRHDGYDEDMLLVSELIEVSTKKYDNATSSRSSSRQVPPSRARTALKSSNQPVRVNTTSSTSSALHHQQIETPSDKQQPKDGDKPPLTPPRSLASIDRVNITTPSPHRLKALPSILQQPVDTNITDSSDYAKVSIASLLQFSNHAEQVQSVAMSTNSLREWYLAKMAANAAI